MSSDFYFRKWRDTLARLENIVAEDLDLQESKTHDKTLCDAVHRLNATLAQYLVVYKDVLECEQQNLQVQKAEYIDQVAMVVMSRITELKQQLKKLQHSDHLFLSEGLIQNKLTTQDVEINDVYPKVQRSEEAEALITYAFERDAERKRLIEEEKAREEAAVPDEPVDRWWDDNDDEDNKDDEQDIKEKEPELTEEQIETNKMVTLIKAHERMRQVVYFFTQQRNKRARWTKELEGTANPPARIELRERSAKLIQKVVRKYFKLKRMRLQDCKRDEILGMRQCLKPKAKEVDKFEKIREMSSSMKNKYNLEKTKEYENMKEKFLKLRRDVIIEDYRDFTREWFRQWYDEIKFFEDIPPERDGGLAAILKDETPSPQEWLEEYEQYLIDKKAKKNKSALQLKYEKLEEEREAMVQKREDALKAKFEEKLRRKMMKNPNMHPGYDFPKSTKTEDLIKAIKQYHELWDELDRGESEDIKKKFVRTVDFSNICMEVKMELMPVASEDMRIELKQLKKALKIDYEVNEEEMPEPMKKKRKREKKGRKQKKQKDENIQEKMDDLISRGFLKEYPKKKLREFIGDPNFAGEDLRCDYQRVSHFHGETRMAWWEKCRQLTRGYQRILLVGPEKTGKTSLVHILASMHDAVLFELDPTSLRSEYIVGVYLNQIVSSVEACAKALQPSVIHIKHVQKMFYRKVPPQEADNNFKLISRYFIKKLFKNINKTDNITIIGTCIEPWVTKNAQLLKQFPNIVLIPDSSYSITVEFLKDWVMCNHIIPPDLDVGSLAYVLKGYSIGLLTQVLQSFLSPEKIIHIKAHGLSPLDIFDYILENDTDGKLDYAQYSKWYSEKTSIGQKEAKHQRDQIEFRNAIELYKQRMEKKKKPGNLKEIIEEDW